MSHHTAGRRPVAVLALPLLVLGAGPLGAQVVNPATAAEQGSKEALQESPTTHLRSWELPPETVVLGQRTRALREEDRVGANGQPRWTAHRRFPSTRVYVRPPGQIEFEHWTRAMTPRSGPSTVENQYELEFGLPYRLQLDLYLVTEKTGSQGEFAFSEQKFEVRHALADWGELWMNPTIYLEYVERSSASDKIETKLLLGDELAEGWHFGTNLTLEHELGGELENEWELSTGISHTILDEKLSLGAEVKAALTDVHADRGNYDKSLEIGPSLQYRPVPNMHVDLAPLVGIGGDSRALDLFLVIGWEF